MKKFVKLIIYCHCWRCQCVGEINLTSFGNKSVLLLNASQCISNLLNCGSNSRKLFEKLSEKWLDDPNAITPLSHPPAHTLNHYANVWAQEQQQPNEKKQGILTILCGRTSRQQQMSSKNTSNKSETLLHRIKSDAIRYYPGSVHQISSTNVRWRILFKA